MKKLFLCLLMLLCCAVMAVAEEAEVETYTEGIYEYTLTDEGAALTNWKWYTDGYVLPEVVELPAKLGGQPVVGIGYNALNTSEMDYEDTFTLIVPEGVKWLDEVAFQCCHNANVIHFPASLTEIPEACFHHVGAEMIVAENNPRYTVQSGYLIDAQTDTLIYCQPSTCGTALPAVRRIGKSSLDNWHSWEMDAIFPAGVQEIGAYALQDTRLASLTLPDGLLLIEEEAICGEIMQPVTIPTSVQLIQRGNFTEPGNTIILLNDATHFETADEYEARTGYRHWMDDWAEE